MVSNNNTVNMALKNNMVCSWFQKVTLFYHCVLLSWCSIFQTTERSCMECCT